MSKNIHYLLVLMVLVLASTGCQTVNGAATGFGQDMHNATDPNQNGWNALENADAWMQKNLW